MKDCMVLGIFERRGTVRERKMRENNIDAGRDLAETLERCRSVSCPAATRHPAEASAPRCNSHRLICRLRSGPSARYGPSAVAETGRADLVEPRGSFAVCSDPANLPFSNQAQQGFENKIAELVAGRAEDTARIHLVSAGDWLRAPDPVRQALRPHHRLRAGRRPRPQQQLHTTARAMCCIYRPGQGSTG